MEPTNTPEPKPMYGFVCFYNGKRHEVYAPTQWDAIKAARAFFKPPKSKQHLVSAILAERPDGSEVTHTPDF